MQKFEMRLLEGVFEKFGQFTQKWVGIDCFFWAMVCTIASLVFFIGIAVGAPSPLLCALFLYAAYKETKAIRLIPKLRRQVYEELSRGCQNKLKISLWEARTRSLKIKLFYIIPCICAAFIIYGFTPVTLFFLLILFHNYPPSAFSSSTPLAPGESKLKKGFKKLGQAFVWEPSQSPLPA